MVTSSVIRDLLASLSVSQWHRIALFVLVACLGVGLGVGFSVASEAQKSKAQDDYDRLLNLFIEWQMILTERFSKAGSYSNAFAAFAKSSATAPANLSAPAIDRIKPINPGAFEQLCVEFYRELPGLFSLQLQSGGVVSQSYPPGSIKVGTDIINMPVYIPIYKQLIEEGLPITAGPTPLQTVGGLGISVRYPVFLNANKSRDSFWGLGNVLMKVVDFLYESGIDVLPDKHGIDYVMWFTTEKAYLVQTGGGTIIGGNESRTELITEVIKSSDPSQSSSIVENGMTMQLPLAEHGKRTYVSLYPKGGLVTEKIEKKLVATIVVVVIVGSCFVVAMLYLALLIAFVFRHRNAPAAGEAAESDSFFGLDDQSSTSSDDEDGRKEQTHATDKSALVASSSRKKDGNAADDKNGKSHNNSATHHHSHHHGSNKAKKDQRIFIAVFTLRGAQPVAERAPLEAVRMFAQFIQRVKEKTKQHDCYAVCEVGDRCVYVVSKSPRKLYELAKDVTSTVVIRGCVRGIVGNGTAAAGGCGGNPKTVGASAHNNNNSRIATSLCIEKLVSTTNGMVIPKAPQQVFNNRNGGAGGEGMPPSDPSDLMSLSTVMAASVLMQQNCRNGNNNNANTNVVEMTPIQTSGAKGTAVAARKGFTTSSAVNSSVLQSKTTSNPSFARNTSVAGSASASVTGGTGLFESSVSSYDHGADSSTSYSEAEGGGGGGSGGGGGYRSGVSTILFCRASASLHVSDCPSAYDPLRDVYFYGSMPILSALAGSVDLTRCGEVSWSPALHTILNNLYFAQNNAPMDGRVKYERDNNKARASKSGGNASSSLSPDFSFKPSDVSRTVKEDGFDDDDDANDTNSNSNSNKLNTSRSPKILASPHPLGFVYDGIEVPITNGSPSAFQQARTSASAVLMRSESNNNQLDVSSSDYGGDENKGEKQKKVKLFVGCFWIRECFALAADGTSVTSQKKSDDDEDDDVVLEGDDEGDVETITGEDAVTNCSDASTVNKVVSASPPTANDSIVVGGDRLSPLAIRGGGKTQGDTQSSSASQNAAMQKKKLLAKRRHQQRIKEQREREEEEEAQENDDPSVAMAMMNDPYVRKMTVIANDERVNRRKLRKKNKSKKNKNADQSGANNINAKTRAEAVGLARHTSSSFIKGGATPSNDLSSVTNKGGGGGVGNVKKSAAFPTKEINVVTRNATILSIALVPVMNGSGGVGGQGPLFGLGGGGGGAAAALNVKTVQRDEFGALLAQVSVVASANTAAQTATAAAAASSPSSSSLSSAVVPYTPLISQSEVAITASVPAEAKKAALDAIFRIVAEERGQVVSVHDATVIVAFNLMGPAGSHQTRAADTVMRLREVFNCSESAAAGGTQLRPTKNDKSSPTANATANNNNNPSNNNNGPNDFDFNTFTLPAHHQALQRHLKSMTFVSSIHNGRVTAMIVDSGSLIMCAGDVVTNSMALLNKAKEMYFNGNFSAASNSYSSRRNTCAFSSSEKTSPAGVGFNIQATNNNNNNINTMMIHPIFSSDGESLDNRNDFDTTSQLARRAGGATNRGSNPNAICSVSSVHGLGADIHNNTSLSGASAPSATPAATSPSHQAQQQTFLMKAAAGAAGPTAMFVVPASDRAKHQQLRGGNRSSSSTRGLLFAAAMGGVKNEVANAIANTTTTTVPFQHHGGLCLLYSFDDLSTGFDCEAIGLAMKERSSSDNGYAAALASDSSGAAPAPLRIIYRLAQYKPSSLKRNNNNVGGGGGGMNDEWMYRLQDEEESSQYAAVNAIFKTVAEALGWAQSLNAAHNTISANNANNTASSLLPPPQAVPLWVIKFSEALEMWAQFQKDELASFCAGSAGGGGGGDGGASSTAAAAAATGTAVVGFGGSTPKSNAAEDPPNKNDADDSNKVSMFTPSPTEGALAAAAFNSLCSDFARFALRLLLGATVKAEEGSN